MTVPGPCAVPIVSAPTLLRFFWDTMRSWGAAPRWVTSGRDVPNIATLGFTNPTAHSIPCSKDANVSMNN